MLGYLAVLAAPGPNMLAVGSLAALRGFRGVAPFCLGVALGAGTLALALHLTFGALHDMQGLDYAARMIGGVLLLLVALRVMRTRRPAVTAGTAPRLQRMEDDLVALAMGFGTAATNPITGAYMLAQFLGPLGQSGVAPLAIPLAVAVALAFGLLVASVFARPAARRIALAHHRAVCVTSGMALASLAVLMLRPLWGA